MAQAPSNSTAPMTEDAFVADRQRFWQGFCNATTITVVSTVVTLVLMAIFLL